MEKIEWGAEPELFGPRHYYRETLLLNRILKNIKKGEVLDAGFGNGSLSLKLLKKGNFNIKGIDLSQKFVEYVSSKIKDKPNVNIYQGNLTSLKFENESFDAVLCGEVLEHIENHDKAVQELARVLKKGGKVFISVPANPKLWDKSDEWAKHFRRYTKESLTQLLQSNGLRVKLIHYWGFPLTRIYHKKLYLKKLEDNNLKTSSKVKKYSKLVSNIFKLDNLFNQTPWGIGLIAVAEK